MSDTEDASLLIPPPGGAPVSPGSRPGVLQVSFGSKSALHAANMPYLKRGGIFVPTTRQYALGDEVFILLNLMDEPEKLPVAGTVAWITPAGAQGSKPQGIGVHFNDDEGGQTARRKIEAILSGYVSSSRSTHTL